MLIISEHSQRGRHGKIVDQVTQTPRPGCLEPFQTERSEEMSSGYFFMLLIKD